MIRGRGRLAHATLTDLPLTFITSLKALFFNPAGGTHGDTHIHKTYRKDRVLPACLLVSPFQFSAL